jgi:CRP-like cAMP-binding protein
MADTDPEEFLAWLEPRDRDDLVARGTRRKWPTGASLLLEGERSAAVILLLTGRVKVFSLTEQGEVVVLALRGPGALLGELSAVGDAPCSATVAALEPTTALVVPVPAFLDFLSTHGRVATVLLRLVTSRLRDADRKRVEFGAQDIAARVAGRLVELAERFGTREERGVRIDVPLSQDELAGWVGASREAVAKALRVLRERGYVTTGRRTMTILDIDGLRRRARL